MSGTNIWLYAFTYSQKLHHQLILIHIKEYWKSSDELLLSFSAGKHKCCQWAIAGMILAQISQLEVSHFQVTPTLQPKQDTLNQL